MRVLIIVHLYYHDMWPELAECIAACPASFDLYVSVVDNEDEARARITAQFPHAKVVMVDNRGFDVGPFIHILNSVDLAHYDAVVKLHSKRDVHAKCIIRGNDVGKAMWRRRLLSFCDSTEHWQKTLCLLQEHGVGMVGNGSLAISPFADPVKNRHEVQQIFSRIGLPFKGGYFVAGTMFAVRAELLSCLQGVYQLSDFDEPDRSQRDCAPHFFERAFGYLIYAQGFKLKSWDGRPFEREVFWSKIQSTIFHTYYGRRHIIYKFFGIPVGWRRWDRDKA